MLFDNDGGDKDTTVFQKYVFCLKMMIPACVCSFIMYFYQILNLIFVGYLGDAQKIAAIGLGNAF